MFYRMHTMNIARKRKRVVIARHDSDLAIQCILCEPSLNNIIPLEMHLGSAVS